MWFQCSLLQGTQIIDVFSPSNQSQNLVRALVHPRQLAEERAAAYGFNLRNRRQSLSTCRRGEYGPESTEDSTLMSCEDQLPFYCSGYQGTEVPVCGGWIGLVMTNNRLLSNSWGARSKPHTVSVVFFQQSQHTSLRRTWSDKWPHLVILHSWQHNVWGWASFYKPQGCSGTVNVCVYIHHRNLSQQRHGVNQLRLVLMGTNSATFMCKLIFVPYQSSNYSM